MKILWDKGGENAAAMAFGIVGARPDPHTHQFCGYLSQICFKVHFYLQEILSKKLLPRDMNWPY